MKKRIKKIIGIIIFIMLCIFFIYISTFLPDFIKKWFLLLAGILSGYFICSEFFL